MKLYNCFSKVEKELGEIELQGLSNDELVELSRKIKNAWNQQILQDEEIVINSLHQITEEFYGRFGYERTI